MIADGLAASPHGLPVAAVIQVAFGLPALEIRQQPGHRRGDAIQDGGEVEVGPEVAFEYPIQDTPTFTVRQIRDALEGFRTWELILVDDGSTDRTPEIVGETDLAAANSLNSLIDNSAIIAGPAIGALLLLVLDMVLVFLLLLVCFTCRDSRRRFLKKQVRED